MRFWRAVTKARTAAYLWFTLLEVILSSAIHAGFALSIAASAVAREVLVNLRTEGAAGSAAGLFLTITLNNLALVHFFALFC